MMSGKFLARASALSLAFMLAACGGDDGSTDLAGGNNTGGSGGTGSSGESENGNADESGSNADVEYIRLLTSQPQIGTGGNSLATITATIKDSNNVLAPDIDVTFEALDGLGDITVNQLATTDAGIANATLSAGQDARNRVITVQATAGTVTETIDIPATGTKLSISGPSNIALGDTASFAVALVDSDNRGVAGETLTITAGGNKVLSKNTMETNSSGTLVVDVEADVSGKATLSASAFSDQFEINAEQIFNVTGDSFKFSNSQPVDDVPLSTSKDLTLNWSVDGTPVDGEMVRFSTTRGTFQPAGKSAIEVPVTSGTATVTLSSEDTGGAAITAKSVDEGISTTLNLEFYATTPASIKLNATKTQITAGETSDISAVVKDVNGNLVKNANITFSLEDVTSGTLSRGSDVTDNQGRARTTYTASETASEKDGVTITADVESTTPVAPEDISLTVGGQALSIIIGTGNTIEAPSEVFYTQPWGILVTDANGNVTPNQDVEVSVLPTRYFQGVYEKNSDDEWVPAYADSNGCIPENAVPTPGPGDYIQNPASSPSRVTTDSEGKFEFDVRYLKGQCNWAEVKLTATARVNGKESQSSQIFTLPCLAEDMKESSPPGGVISSYGSGTASDNSLNCKVPE